MGKIIVHNSSESIGDAEALALVAQVVSEGRISGNGQFCFLTAFKRRGVEIHIVSDKNEKSDRFTIYDRKK